MEALWGPPKSINNGLKPGKNVEHVIILLESKRAAGTPQDPPWFGVKVLLFKAFKINNDPKLFPHNALALYEGRACVSIGKDIHGCKESSLRPQTQTLKPKL